LGQLPGAPLSTPGHIGQKYGFDGLRSESQRPAFDCPARPSTSHAFKGRRPAMAADLRAGSAWLASGGTVIGEARRVLPARAANQHFAAFTLSELDAGFTTSRCRSQMIVENAAVDSRFAVVGKCLECWKKQG
jgi:hypothetical protein